MKIEGRVRILGKIRWRCGNKPGQTVHNFSRISKGIIYNKEGGQWRGRENKKGNGGGAKMSKAKLSMGVMTS